MELTLELQRELARVALEVAGIEQAQVKPKRRPTAQPTRPRRKRTLAVPT